MGPGILVCLLDHDKVTTPNYLQFDITNLPSAIIYCNSLHLEVTLTISIALTGMLSMQPTSRGMHMFLLSESKNPSSSSTVLAGSIPNSHTMVPRWVCIKSVLNINFKVKGQDLGPHMCFQNFHYFIQDIGQIYPKLTQRSPECLKHNGTFGSTHFLMHHVHRHIRPRILNFIQDFGACTIHIVMEKNCFCKKKPQKPASGHSPGMSYTVIDGLVDK